MVDVLVLYEVGSDDFIYHVGDLFFVHVMQIRFLCLIHGERLENDVQCTEDEANFGSSVAGLAYRGDILPIVNYGGHI